MALAILVALAVQGLFTAVQFVPETVFPPAARLAIGLVSVPFSALCGTLVFRRRRPDRSLMHLAMLFLVLLVIIVVAGLIVSVATGRYDLP
jgi:hypothetical protein